MTNGTNVALVTAANTFGAFNQTFDTNTLFIDSISDRVGIGTTSPQAELSVRKLGSSQGETIFENSYMSTCNATAQTIYTFNPSSSGVVYVNSADISAGSNAQYQAVTYWSFATSVASGTSITENVGTTNADLSISTNDLQIICSGSGLNEIAITVVGNIR